MPSILFVCVHNACRSQIAEAVCKKLVSDSWVVASAGSKPSQAVDPKAVQILKAHGLAMNSLKPKGFSDLSVKQWNYVVGMGCGDVCDQDGVPAKRAGAEMVGARQSGNRPYVAAKNFIEWNIPDPYDGPMELYQALYDDLTQRIQALILTIK